VLKYSAVFMVKLLINIPNAVGSDFFRLLKTAFCDSCQCLQVKSSLRLQLVVSCSYHSILNIGLGDLLKLLEVTICFFMSVRPSVCKKNFAFKFGISMKFSI